MAKPIYTHPELAAYLKKLVVKETKFWRSEIEYITRKFGEKTIWDMIAQGALMLIENRLKLPPPSRGIIRNSSTEEDKRFWAFVDKTAEEVKKWPPWMRGECEYKHPELAAHILKLVMENPMWWRFEIEYRTRMAVEKTADEMLAQGALVLNENCVELPQPQNKPTSPKKPKRHEGG